jgi:hypothetical protein
MNHAFVFRAILLPDGPFVPIEIVVISVALSGWSSQRARDRPRIFTGHLLPELHISLGKTYGLV